MAKYETLALKTFYTGGLVMAKYETLALKTFYIDADFAYSTLEQTAIEITKQMNKRGIKVLDVPAKLARPKGWTVAKSGRLIRKAAEIMNDKGYTKGLLHDSNGFCVRGAVNYAWCGNHMITDNYEYADDAYHPVTTSTGRRNPEAIYALTDFREFLRENGLIEGRAGVEAFNDKNNKDEVIRWMYKFADEVDPQK